MLRDWLQAGPGQEVIMLLGLRTAIYPVQDLAAAKAWYARVIGHAPYFDQPFYVGFDVGGFELGLVPDGAPGTDGSTTTVGRGECRRLTGPVGRSRCRGAGPGAGRRRGHPCRGGPGSVRQPARHHRESALQARFSVLMPERANVSEEGRPMNTMSPASPDGGHVARDDAAPPVRQSRSSSTCPGSLAAGRVPPANPARSSSGHRSRAERCWG